MKWTDRLFQRIVAAMLRDAKWKMPKVIRGNGSLLELPNIMKEEGVRNAFVVTTKGTITRGTLDHFFAELEKREIGYCIFSEVMPDPTISCIEEALSIYHENNCDCIAAIGGGSVLDCSKVLTARISRPDQDIKKMAGAFKIKKRTIPFYAVPTTAGTASETTITAVVTDETNHYKFTISDGCLLPDYAILDPMLTKDLPAKLTAATGMDALTHAVEAYTNLYSSKSADQKAKKAVKLIFENLEQAFDDGSNLKIRENMLNASFYAGEAFTRSLVGYVHGIAHAVGGIYGVPHGEANAIIMPYVLEAYGPAVYGALSELAAISGMKTTGDQKKDAQAFIEKIREMNAHMHIEKHLPQIQDKDMPVIVDRIYREVHTYPTPVIWNKRQLRQLLLKIKG